MNKIKLSNLQLKIIDDIKDNNVIINGLTGTGKTTTGVFIANKYSNKKILYLSIYKICVERIKKVIEINEMKNINVFTIKDFIKENYNVDLKNNIEVNKLLLEEKKQIFTYYDIIIIDEIEDFNNLYYKLICKILSNNKTNNNICLIGDTNQSLEIKNSDPKYLMYAKNLFDNGKLWKKYKLNNSYTFNNKTAQFLNNGFFKDEDIKTIDKNKSKINYLVANTWNSNLLIKKIKKAINKYGLHNILILVPSVENKNISINYIIDNIVENLAEIYIPNNDYDDEIDKNNIINKLVIVNYSQAKMIKRKIVFVFNYDMSYFEFANQEYNKNQINNSLYIATTRATKSLTLIQDYKNKKLDFLENNNLNKILKSKIDNECKIKYQNIIDLNIDNNKNIIHKKIDKNIQYKDDNLNIIDKLISYLPIEIEKDIKNSIVITDEKNIINNQLEKDFSKLEININNKLNIENVSKISKEAIIYNYEKQYYKKNKNILNILNNIFENDQEFLKQHRNHILKYQNFISELNKDNKIISNKNSLIISNLWNYYVYNDINKFNNINESAYNWIKNNDNEKINELINKQISKFVIFKTKVVKNEQYEKQVKEIFAYIDCIDIKNNTVWEFTYENKINKLTFLKLAIISYLINENENLLLEIVKTSIKMKLKANEINYDENLKNINFKFKILNLKNNSIYEISTDFKKIKNIINKIFEFKSTINYEKDKLFIQSNLELKDIITQ